MPATPKRMKPWKDALPPGKQYPIDTALQLVKDTACPEIGRAHV